MKIIRPPPRAGWGTAGRVSAVLQVILLYAEVYFWQRNEFSHQAIFGPQDSFKAGFPAAPRTACPALRGHLGTSKWRATGRNRTEAPGGSLLFYWVEWIPSPREACGLGSEHWRWCRQVFWPGTSGHLVSISSATQFHTLSTPTGCPGKVSFSFSQFLQTKSFSVQV